MKASVRPVDQQRSTLSGRSGRLGEDQRLVQAACTATSDAQRRLLFAPCEYSWRSIRHGGTTKSDWSLCSRMHICGAAGTMAILLHRNKGTGGLSIRGTDTAGNPSGDQRSSTTGRRCTRRVQLGDDLVIVRRAGAELGHVNGIERGLRPDTKQTTRQKMRHSFAKARASVVTRNPRTAVADPTQSRWDRTLAQRGGGCATHSCSTLSRQDLTLPPTRAIDLRYQQRSDRPPVTSAAAPAHPYQFTPVAAAAAPRGPVLVSGAADSCIHARERRCRRETTIRAVVPAQTWRSSEAAATEF